MNDCIWQGSDQPRAIKRRHEDDCEDEGCRGCLPCPGPHCIVCGIEHVDQRTCPECVGQAREDVFEIRKLWRNLPRHALVGGNNGKLEAAREIPGGEAMVLLIPGSHGKGATAAKRRGDDASHLEDERDSETMLPELCLVNWEEDWRRMLGNPPDPDVPASLEDAATFLDEHLSWAAQEHDAFDEFAREVRQQRAHIEDVLHAGERTETGAPCLEHNKPLVKVYGKTEADDRWVCPRCPEPVSLADYARNTAQEGKKYAEWLTATDMAEVYDINVGTLQGWASKKLVKKRRDVNLGRMVYRVEQAKALRDAGAQEPA